MAACPDVSGAGVPALPQWPAQIQTLLKQAMQWSGARARVDATQLDTRTQCSHLRQEVLRHMHRYTPQARSWPAVHWVVPCVWILRSADPTPRHNPEALKDRLFRLEQTQRLIPLLHQGVAWDDRTPQAIGEVIPPGTKLEWPLYGPLPPVLRDMVPAEAKASTKEEKTEAERQIQKREDDCKASQVLVAEEVMHRAVVATLHAWSHREFTQSAAWRDFDEDVPEALHAWWDAQRKLRVHSDKTTARIHEWIWLRMVPWGVRERTARETRAPLTSATAESLFQDAYGPYWTSRVRDVVEHSQTKWKTMHERVREGWQWLFVERFFHGRFGVGFIRSYVVHGVLWLTERTRVLERKLDPDHALPRRPVIVLWGTECWVHDWTHADWPAQVHARPNHAQTATLYRCASPTHALVCWGTLLRLRYKGTLEGGRSIRKWLKRWLPADTTLPGSTQDRDDRMDLSWTL